MALPLSRLASLAAFSILAGTSGAGQIRVGAGSRNRPNYSKPGPAPAAGRNEKCPCGSGKKYKKCCRGKKS